MTEAGLRRLLEKWKQRLGLDLWRIELRVEPCDESDSFMEVQRQVSYRRSVIKVQPWALTGNVPRDVIEIALTDEHLEHTLVHELLHLFTTGMQSVVSDDLDGQMHRDVYTTARSAFQREEERCVDSLADALVRNWGS